MKREKTLILIVIAIAGIFLAAIAARNSGQASVPTNQAHKSQGGVEEKERDKHDEKGERKEEHEKRISLAWEDQEKFGIEVDTAGPGKLDVQLTFPAEITVNWDHTAQIVPRLTGVVSEVRKNIGDTVAAGEVMAVIESRDLAEAKAKYLAALSRLELAQTNFTKYENLFKTGAVPEKQLLEMKNAFEEADIERRSAKHKLLAMGLSAGHLKELVQRPEEDSLTRFEVVAPFAGTVTSKRITLGEMRKEDYEAFVISDLDSVWANISVSQKDLPYVKQGQTVTISTGNGIPDAQGGIAYLEPVVGDKTRSAIARVVLRNSDKQWSPGLFVTAKVIVSTVDVGVLLPKSAVQSIAGKSVVFVREGEGFEARAVKIGRQNVSHVEISSGVNPGDWFASKQSFLLKADLGKSEVHEHD
jgi:cobalt-zinc-cadmium efflux system membrane fusion protein